MTYGPVAIGGRATIAGSLPQCKMSLIARRVISRQRSKRSLSGGIATVFRGIATVAGGRSTVEMIRCNS
jgi:hypothetical protein